MSQVAHISTALPEHVGIIPDGNRRWSRERSLPTLEGHRRGVEVFRTLCLAAFDRGIKNMTFFAFSTENWNRRQEEVGYLMGLFVKLATKDVQELHDRNVCVRFLGSRHRLNAKLVTAIENAEKLTEHNQAGTVAFCLNYGGQQEIADAVAGLIAAGTKAEDVTPDLISAHLYAPDIPPLDLIIRTSGEQRLSGFMLWESAYAEFAFIDKNYPDFTVDDFDEVLADYARRQRRFGG